MATNSRVLRQYRRYGEKNATLSMTQEQALLLHGDEEEARWQMGDMDTVGEEEIRAAREDGGV